MKCTVCKCGNSDKNLVTKAPDPYSSEINGDDTEIWMCEGCRDESCMEI